MMENHFSTSISKMNGFPILPPLITNEIATEIQYYKQLAIAVKERLNVLETIEKDKHELNKNRVAVSIEDDNNSRDFIFISENDNIKQKFNSIDEKIIDYPTKDKIDENLIDITTPVKEKVKNYYFIHKESDLDQKQKKLQVDKIVSDDDKSYSNEAPFCSSVSPDTITISTDLNQYLNTSVSTKTDTTDTTPEIWKPEVPKTLDIVPILVDTQKSSDKSNLIDEEIPRLVRRGSYVLDAPSPMLLALMQNELTDTDTNTSPQSVKGKESNTKKIKTNCEKQTNCKEPTLFHLNSTTKFRKGHHSNIPHRVCRSVSNSKTCSPSDMYQTTKSVDCIQAMFVKEFYSPKSANSKYNNQNKINSSPGNAINGIRKHDTKKIVKNKSILNLANKLSESLGTLNNVNLKPSNEVETKSNDLNLEINSNPNCAKNSDSTEENLFFPMKKKPIVTSEKIITIFKEIQDTHKSQMIDLMTRQQKEQIVMHENFKKQQILLLAQIRKTFPEISISALSEAISSKNIEHNTDFNLKMVNEESESEKQKDIKKLQVNGMNCKKDEITINKSSINQSKELSSTSCHHKFQSTILTKSSIYESNYQPNQNCNDSFINSHIQIPVVRAIDDIPVGSPIRRHSHVSRQLFPLDNKIIRAPNLDNFVYREEHIKAATIINAYAKGFLVRRLMKTEKIIALKNTYKEALHCMLRLHVDEPLQLAEIRFKERLQQQCDATSMNIVDLFSQDPAKQMEIISHDREIKTARSGRPSSARSYSFATQRTLARKKFKEIGICPSLHYSSMSRSCPVRTRCQTLPSNTKEKKCTNSLINHGIKRSTSAGTVRKPWR